MWAAGNISRGPRLSPAAAAVSSLRMHPAVLNQCDSRQLELTTMGVLASARRPATDVSGWAAPPGMWSCSAGCTASRLPSLSSPFPPCCPPLAQAPGLLLSSQSPSWSSACISTSCTRESACLLTRTSHDTFCQLCGMEDTRSTRPLSIRSTRSLSIRSTRPLPNHT